MKKVRVWKTSTADIKWREHLLSTRKPVCAKCGLGGELQVSHYWTRDCSSTRFYGDNCDLLHYACHYGNWRTGWEYQKQGAYRKYKLKQLGPERYKALEKRFYQDKTTRRGAIINLMKLLNKYD